MKTNRLMPTLAGALAVLLCLAAPASLAGQQAGTLGLTAGAGLGLPAGALSDVSDAGPAFRFGTAYALGPSYGVLGTIEAEVFSSVTGPGGDGPSVRLFRLLVGPTFTVVRPEAREGLRLDLHGGAGVTLFSAGRTLVGTGSDVRAIDLNEAYFGLGGGLTAAYEFSPSVGAYLGAGASLGFADEQDTEVFAFLDPAVEPFSTLVSVPITAGVRLSFPR